MAITPDMPDAEQPHVDPFPNGSPDGGHSTRSLSALGNSKLSDSHAIAPFELHTDRSSTSGSDLRIADIGLPDLLGAALDDYRLGRCLGSGGMGVVYEAKHRLLGKSFALKFIHRDSAGSSDARARFIQEFTALGRLDHPNIVNAVDAGSVDDVFYYVTELLIGRDLTQWRTACDAPSIEAVCEILRQAALGLQHAHEHGFVHRDVKPSNIFLTDNGQVKILDFGLVRDRETNGSITQAGDLIGTVDFFSPEQAEDFRACTATADIYSLGATAVYLFSGEVPYPDRDYPSIVSKLRGHMTGRPQWFEVSAAKLPSKLHQLLVSMMSHQPQSRPQSCREVAAALTAWSSAEDVSDWLHGHTCADGSMPSTGSGSAHQRRVLRRAALFALPIGLATLAAGSFAFRTTPNQSNDNAHSSTSTTNANGDTGRTSVAAEPPHELNPPPVVTETTPIPTGKPVTVSRNERKPHSAKPIQLEPASDYQAKQPLGPITRSPKD